MGRIKPELPAQMNICTIFHLAYKDLRKGDYTSGPNAITRVLRGGRRRKRSDVAM